jgi:hypothetical protein
MRWLNDGCLSLPGCECFEEQLSKYGSGEESGKDERRYGSTGRGEGQSHRGQPDPPEESAVAKRGPFGSEVKHRQRECECADPACQRP